jgi:hypothetical protein
VFDGNKAQYMILIHNRMHSIKIITAGRCFAISLFSFRKCKDYVWTQPTRLLFSLVYDYTVCHIIKVHEGLEIILASDREHSDDYEYEW